MDKAKFYAQINQYFNSDVMSLASGTPWGRTIPGSQVVDYSLLCITKIVEGKDVSLWISQVDTDSPVAEIRISEQVAKQNGQTDLDFLLTFPFSKFVISGVMDKF